LENWRGGVLGNKIAGLEKRELIGNRRACSGMGERTWETEERDLGWEIGAQGWEIWRLSLEKPELGCKTGKLDIVTVGGGRHDGKHSTVRIIKGLMYSTGTVGGLSTVSS